MADQYISAVDNHYFQYHIVATFAEYLNNIEQHSYLKLNDLDWEACCNEFIPILKDKKKELGNTPKNIFDKTMAKFPKDFLTEDQSNELLIQVEKACQDFINCYNPVCYCGDKDCEWDCGVLDCGCIDICRNRCGLNRDRYNRY